MQKDGLRSTEKCNLLIKDKIWCIYFGLFLELSWPMQICEVSITKVETIVVNQLIYEKMVGSTQLLCKCGTMQFIKEAKTSYVVTC